MPSNTDLAHPKRGGEPILFHVPNSIKLHAKETGALWLPRR